MADLIEEILSIEKRCDELLKQASEKAQQLKQSGERQIAAEREQAAEAFERLAASLRQESTTQLKARSEQLAREHDAAMKALASIPQSTLEAQVRKILQRLLES